MPNQTITKFMTAEEILKDAEATDLIERAIEEVRKGYESDTVDKEQASLNETWAILAHQVVGQESF